LVLNILKKCDLTFQGAKVKKNFMPLKMKAQYSFGTSRN
jgi:hypothetical protein